MTSFGKKCREDKDCPSGVCEMTYDKKQPLTRRCTVEKGSQSKDSDEVRYTGQCEQDEDCESNLCEPKHIVNKSGVRETVGKFCIDQKKIIGNDCNNNNDCDSGRCATQYDTNNIPVSRKCIVFNNQPEIKNPNRNFGEVDEKDKPEFAQDPAWKQAREEEYILPNKTKAKKLEGRGIISDIIILVMEIVVLVLKSIFLALFTIWKLIFMGVSYLPSLLLRTNYLGFTEKYKCKNKSGCKTSCDNDRAYTISRKLILKSIVVLFPPYGVFIAKGMSSIKEILYCCFLTILFYIPGLKYGLDIIDEMP